MSNNQLLKESNPFARQQVGSINVANLSDVHVYLNEELGAISNRITAQLNEIKKAVLLDADDKKKIKFLEAQTKLLLNIYDQLVKNGKIKNEITVSPANIPDVHVPEIRLPDIIIPEIKLPEINVPRAIVNVEAPNVTVEAPIIDLTNLQKMLEPILRLTELLPIMDELTKYPDKQQTFLEELARESNRNLSNMSAAFSGSSGMSKDEFIDATKRLYRSQTATNTYATVGATSSAILSANGSRISATFTNDSDATIYLSKGEPAVLGSGIRLNASGGALINDEFTGIIYAISSGAGKNICISEVY